jgi:hypothetical protein
VFTVSHPSLAIIVDSFANMRPSTASFAFLSLVSAVNGDIHQLIVGTFGTEKLYTLEFDDSALTLELIGNLTTNAASSWIALSVSVTKSSLWLSS